MKPSSRVLVSVYFPALFFFVFILFLKTFCSSVYIDDSGETITVAWVLGAGHPPGYPLHTLLGNLLLRLPLGAPAPLYNLYSSLLGALTVPLAAGFFLRLMPRLAPQRWKLFSVTLAAFAMALGPTYWSNATGAKGSIYMLNNLISLALLWLAFEAPVKKTAARLFWLILGLGLAHHYMSQLILLPVYAYLARVRGKVSWHWFTPAWLCLPGISLYLYFPLRSANHPLLDWAQMGSFKDFIFYVFRIQYATSEFTRSFSNSLRQSWQALQFIFWEGQAGILTLLALVGGYRSCKDKSAGRALLAGIALPLLAVTLYLNLEPERLNIMAPYLFPAYLSQAALAALGLNYLPQALKNYRARTMAVSTLVTLFLLITIKTYTKVNKSNWFFGLDNAHNVMLGLPRKAMFFAWGDSLIFPLWYLQEVQQQRRDIALVGVPVLPMQWVRDKLKRDHPDMILPLGKIKMGKEAIPMLVQGLLRYNQPSRPAYTNRNKADASTGPWLPHSRGNTYELEPAGKDVKFEPQHAENILKAIRWRGIYESSSDLKTRTVLIKDLAIHHNSLGTTYEETGDFENAYRHYKEASKIAPWDEEFPYNVGNASFRAGRSSEAIIWYKESLRRNPRYTNAWFNLGVVLSRIRRSEEARVSFEKVEALEPGRPEIQRFLGR